MSAAALSTIHPKPLKLALVDDSRLGFASASKMPAIFQCDGLLGMEHLVEQQRVKPPEGNRDAAKGTLIHKHVETGDVSDLDPADAELVSDIRDTEERLVGDWIASSGHTLSDVTIYRELRLWVPGLFSAQGDTIVINHKNNTALVNDNKTGRRPVQPPVRNWQLRSIALAVYKRYGVHPIRTVIVQPYAKEMPYCDYTEEHLKTIEERLTERINFVRHPGLQRKPGDWCKYCQAKHICPEAKSSLSLILRSQDRLKWDTLAPETKKQLWIAASMAEDVVEAIKGMVRKELSENPEAIPGLIKHKDQSPRSINNTKEFTLALVDYVFRDVAPSEELDQRKARVIVDLLDLMKISFADAADFLRNFNQMTKKSAESLLVNSFQDFIEVGSRQGKITVQEKEGK